MRFERWDKCFKRRYLLLLHIILFLHSFVLFVYDPKKMNFFSSLLLAWCLYAVSAFLIHNDGRPSCTNQEEINIHIFRNNWDPTSYWTCFELNTPARLDRCPDETAFLDSVKDCVSWDNWQWEDPTSAQAIDK